MSYPGPVFLPLRKIISPQRAWKSAWFTSKTFSLVIQDESVSFTYVWCGNYTIRIELKITEINREILRSQNYIFPHSIKMWIISLKPSDRQHFVKWISIKGFCFPLLTCNKKLQIQWFKGIEFNLTRLLLVTAHYPLGWFSDQCVSKQINIIC